MIPQLLPTLTQLLSSARMGRNEKYLPFLCIIILFCSFAMSTGTAGEEGRIAKNIAQVKDRTDTLLPISIPATLIDAKSGIDTYILKRTDDKTCTNNNYHPYPETTHSHSYVLKLSVTQGLLRNIQMDPENKNSHSNHNKNNNNNNFRCPIQEYSYSPAQTISIYGTTIQCIEQQLATIVYRPFILGDIDTPIEEQIKYNKTYSDKLSVTLSMIHQNNSDSIIRTIQRDIFITPIQSTIEEFVTLNVKTHDRPKCLEDLIESIRKYYPGVRVLVMDDGKVKAWSGKVSVVDYYPVDFDIGLSAARNKMVDMVR